MGGSHDSARLPETHRLVHLEVCASTNSEAMRRAIAGDALPLWVITDRQTAGRGRSGRAWQSLPGNLLASLAVPLRGPMSVAAELSLVAGNAVIDAVRNARPGLQNLRLKWPNDVLLGGAKLGGILVESAATAHGVVVVIGIGLNLAGHPEGIDRPAAHLFDNENEPCPLDMLAHVGQTMHQWLCVWDEGRGLAEVRAGWLERAGPPGEALGINAGSRFVSGSFAGLDAGGALLLATPDGRIERFTFGDVTLAAT